MRVGDADVRFRGLIDRVDLDSEGRRAYLFDYKTGSSSSYKNASQDPLLAGQHVQLALYRRAVLNAMPELEEVRGAFWFVSSRGRFERLEPTSSDLNPDERLDEVLLGITRGIGSGAFPQVPGEETQRPGKTSWENCVYCDFSRICPSDRDSQWERKREAKGYRAHAELSAISHQPSGERNQPPP